MLKDNEIALGFTTKIYPTKSQIKYFKECFGISRFAYNWYLDIHESLYKMNIDKNSFYEMRKMFFELKDLYPWINNISTKIVEQALANAKDAFERFFKKQNRYPRHKFKRGKQSFSTTRVIIKCPTSKNVPMSKMSNILNGSHFYISGKTEKCGKTNGYFIKTAENIKFLENYKIIKLCILFDGINYYASFSYKLKKQEYRNNSNKTVGIDLGIKTYAVQSDKIISKFPLKKIKFYERKIDILNKVISNKIPSSNNYKKAIVKLNKYYKKITFIKKDFLHKYTTWLAKNYKKIKIEDLNIRGMLKNRCLSKSIARLNFREFRDILEYKTKLYDSELVIVDRFFASTKICHNCGNKKKMKLSDRLYICPICGYIEDRDLNAALNIRDWK